MPSAKPKKDFAIDTPNRHRGGGRFSLSPRLVLLLSPLRSGMLKMGQKIALQQKHTTAGIRWWSPTQLLICRSEACVWQSGRDAQFSSVYGRMWLTIP
jgi:hypothetical protein